MFDRAEPHGGCLFNSATTEPKTDDYVSISLFPEIGYAGSPQVVVWMGIRASLTVALKETWRVLLPVLSQENCNSNNGEQRLLDPANCPSRLHDISAYLSVNLNPGSCC